MKSIFHAAAVVAATAGLVVPVAMAQSAKPEPGCAGFYADKKGDVEYENLDITGFWFKTEGNKLTANMRVANLSTAIPDGATGMSWYVMWNNGEETKFAQVLVEAPLNTPSFHVGTVQVTGNTNQRTREVDTVGQFIEGADGVWQVEVPEEYAGPKGFQLKSVTADTNFSIGVPGVLSSLQPVDDAAGKTYTVNGCEGGAPGPAPAPAPAPAPPTPSNSDRQVAAGKLDAAVSKKVPKAKKVKKSLTLSLTSKGGVSEVDAALFQGAVNKKKIVAQGKLASAKGKAKLKLKVTKKLKKGSYTLYLVGKNADGTAADKSFKLKFR